MIKYSIILALIALLIALAGYIFIDANSYGSRSKLKARRKINHNKLSKKLSVIDPYLDNLAYKIDIITLSHSTSIKLIKILIIVYVLVFTLIAMTGVIYARIWYAILLNLAVAVIIPLLFIKVIINYLIHKVLKQLPDAIDELESAYYSTHKLRQAIEVSYPKMPGRIMRLFETLYYDMMYDEVEAVKKFRRSFNNNYIDALSILFLIYIENGGTGIGEKLQKLNIMIHDDLMTEKLTSGRLLKFKFLAIGTILAIPIFIWFSTKISPSIGIYYNGTASGSTLVTMTILGIVAYFFFVEILERV